MNFYCQERLRVGFYLHLVSYAIIVGSIMSSLSLLEVSLYLIHW
ncbi:hypothetical protein ACP70R_028968 [Stipagrostis hirtigluma subsp. patula]